MRAYPSLSYGVQNEYKLSLQDVCEYQRLCVWVGNRNLHHLLHFLCGDVNPVIEKVVQSEGVGSMTEIIGERQSGEKIIQKRNETYTPMF